MLILIVTDQNLQTIKSCRYEQMSWISDDLDEGSAVADLVFSCTDFHDSLPRSTSVLLSQTPICLAASPCLSCVCVASRPFHSVNNPSTLQPPAFLSTNSSYPCVFLLYSRLDSGHSQSLSFCLSFTYYALHTAGGAYINIIHSCIRVCHCMPVSSPFLLKLCPNETLVTALLPF